MMHFRLIRNPIRHGRWLCMIATVAMIFALSVPLGSTVALADNPPGPPPSGSYRN